LIFHRTPGRRRLRFQEYQDILDDVEALRANHRQLGNWSLGQICDHLATTQAFSLDGGAPAFKKSPLYRVTVGQVALRALLWWGFIPEKQGDMPLSAPVDLQAGMERLRGTLARIATEPMTTTHPIFGRLNQGQWKCFHLCHAAHHLSFLIPAETPHTEDRAGLA